MMSSNKGYQLRPLQKGEINEPFARIIPASPFEKGRVRGISNMNKSLSLGIDVSTQSISAVVLDMDTITVVWEHSLDYCRDNRLNTFGIRPEDYILLPETEGEANQPAGLFLAALDTLFTDLKRDIDPGDITVINTSGQQHGHAYLSSQAPDVFRQLLNKGSGQSDLNSLLKGSLAWDKAPIWMTSDTYEQAEFIRNHVGGKRRMIELSGADAPLRFTGIVIRKIGQKFPDIYNNTEKIQLISSIIPAVLTGNTNVPVDFGNASGMALMDYRRKDWSDELVGAVSEGLPGGEESLKSKLPKIVSPDSVVGTISTYFVTKFGFSPECKIIAGSGDNPQSKVLVTGDLLSLGTSIVNMVSTDGKTLDMNGYASAMYDGIGRPFMFGTRTNGVMVWDNLRARYGLGKNEYIPAEETLEKAPVGENLLFWQPRNESFPPSGSIDITRIGDFTPDLGIDYAALIETTLAAVYIYSKGFTRETDEILHVTGGARHSREILRRIAAVWNRPVVPIETGGASLGAAVAGAISYYRSEGKEVDILKNTGLLKKGRKIHPQKNDIEAFHKPGGFLERYTVEETKLLF
ncbi:MAG TPA: xylulose kinase [Dehalococcoidia bacterium]|nr:xylulose kinase [Dehalococcoidia bacterium]